jgi:hypothetical protein
MTLLTLLTMSKLAAYARVLLQPLDETMSTLSTMSECQRHRYLPSHRPARPLNVNAPTWLALQVGNKPDQSPFCLRPQDRMRLKVSAALVADWLSAASAVKLAVTARSPALMGCIAPRDTGRSIRTPFRTPGSLFSRPATPPLAWPHVRHVFSLKAVWHATDAVSSMARSHRWTAAPRSSLRNGGGGTFFPALTRIPREARKSLVEDAIGAACGIHPGRPGPPAGHASSGHGDDVHLHARTSPRPRARSRSLLGCAGVPVAQRSTRFTAPLRPTMVGTIVAKDDAPDFEMPAGTGIGAADTGSSRQSAPRDAAPPPIDVRARPDRVRPQPMSRAAHHILNAN